MDPPRPGQPSDNKKIKPPILKIRVETTERKRLSHGRDGKRGDIATQRLEYPRLGFEKIGWADLSPRESRGW
jgi:hypothetical protein